MACPVRSVLSFFVLTSAVCFGDLVQSSSSLLKTGDVIQLSDSNFAARLAGVDLALVKFYAPWCGHCQQLAPEFEKAATELKKSNGSPITLAEVDCTADGKELCLKHGVTGYPVLKVFKGGKAVFDYDGPRESPSIVSFMKSKAGPSSKELKTTEEVEQFLNYTELIVFGFFEQTEMIQEFQKLADELSNKIRFGYTTSDEIGAKYMDRNEIVLFREARFQSKLEPSRVTYRDGEVTLNKLKDWVFQNLHSLVGHRTMNNVDEFKQPLVVIYFDVDYEKNAKGTTYWRNRIVKVAKKFSDAGRNVSFAMSNANEFRPEVDGYGLKFSKTPVVSATDMSLRKFRMTEEFSPENLENFVESFLEGNMKPYLKSEPIPETNNDPVKVVVGETFNEIVNDVTKDVLIELYSSMCGHCLLLTPKYKKLAEKLKDETDLVIAQMDGVANEAPDVYEVQGFPTIYFAPKGSKDKPILYTGEHEVDGFVKFLAKEATTPLKGFNRKGRPIRKSKETSTTSDKIEL